MKLSNVHFSDMTQYKEVIGVTFVPAVRVLTPPTLWPNI